MADKTRLTREQIAQRAAQELPDGAYVNLGWGIPNLIADYLPKGITVYFHSENGILGMGPRAKPGEEDSDLVDAMKVPVTMIPGAIVLQPGGCALDDPWRTSGCGGVGRLSGLGEGRFGELENSRIKGQRSHRRRDGHCGRRAKIDRVHGAHIRKMERQRS